MQIAVDSSNFRRFRRKIDCFQPAVLDVSKSVQIFRRFRRKNECFKLTACQECWICQIFGDFGEKWMLSACMQRVVECSNFRRSRRKSKPMLNVIYFNSQLKYTCLHFRIIFSEISAKICNSNKNIFSILLYRELKKVNVNVNVKFNACNFWEILAKICNSNKNIFSIYCCIENWKR